MKARERRTAASSRGSVFTRLDDVGADGSACRLGIMGGTFDPIHKGHIAIAECAMRSLALEGVLFVVAGDPWMKHGKALSSADDRLAMVCAAIEDAPRFAASRIEIDRAGESYAVDTLRELRGFYPDNVELVFLLGLDAALHLSEWHDAGSLGGLARFAVVSRRPGFELKPGVLQNIAHAIGASEITEVGMPAMDVSSTDLREKAKAGLSIADSVPPVVADYIQTHGLYRR